jgi:head-tail adaptor
MRLIHDLFVLNPTTTEDRYHNDVDTWTTPATFVEKGWLTQQSSAEVVDGRDATNEEWKGYFESCTELTARSRVRWCDRTFEVVGTPKPCTSPIRNGVHHVEARLRIVEG